MIINEDFFDGVDEVEVEDKELQTNDVVYPYTLIVQMNSLDEKMFNKCMDEISSIEHTPIVQDEVSQNYIMRFDSNMETIQDVVNFIAWLWKGCKYETDSNICMFGLRFNDQVPVVFRYMERFKKITNARLEYTEAPIDSDIIYNITRLAQLLLKRHVDRNEISFSLGIFDQISRMLQFEVYSSLEELKDMKNAYKINYPYKDEKRFYTTSKLIDDFIKYYMTLDDAHYIKVTCIIGETCLQYKGDKVSTQSLLYKEFLKKKKKFIIDKSFIGLYYNENTKEATLFVPFYYKFTEKEILNELLLQIRWITPEQSPSDIIDDASQYIDMLKINNRQQ